jgi:predicted DNA-binding ribbon-helix-helix protein
MRGEYGVDDNQVLRARGSNGRAGSERDPFAPEFRVVTRGNTRRGIRLERVFWTTLKRLAESRKTTLGALVDEIAHEHGASANLTSSIRVTCVRWLEEQNAELMQASRARPPDE